MTKKQRKVFVTDEGGAGGVRLMFLEEAEKYIGTKHIENADVVCFVGGADVDPQLYGDRLIRGTFIDPSRDKRDEAVYDKARQLGKFMVGICRGSQFLNVMNQGTMWQHVSGHGLSGTHEAFDVRTGEMVPVTSTHHQESRLAASGRLLMYAKEAVRKDADGEFWARTQNPDGRDTEAFFYPATRCLGYQPHPEYCLWGHPCRRKFFNLLDEFIENKEYEQSVISAA